MVGCSLLVRSECVMSEAPAMLVSVGRVRDKPKTVPLFSQQKFVKSYQVPKVELLSTRIAVKVQLPLAATAGCCSVNLWWLGGAFN